MKWRLIATTEMNDEFKKRAVGGKLNLPRALNDVLLIRRKGVADDIPVESIDQNSPEWKALLKCEATLGRVIRLHKAGQCGSKSPNCTFTRLHYLSARDDASLDSAKSVGYFRNKTYETVPIADLEDVIFADTSYGECPGEAPEDITARAHPRF